MAAVAPEYQLMVQLLYGTGMRLMECLRLRVKDVDFAQSKIETHDGKGFKDRITMLPDIEAVGICKTVLICRTSQANPQKPPFK